MVNFVFAQQPIADIEGTLKIRGDIDIQNANDSTSLYIGRRLLPDTGTIDIERFNTKVGVRTGEIGIGRYNTFVGYESGMNTTSVSNTFIGYQAGMSNENAFSNTFVGYQAGLRSTIGIWNTFTGNLAGEENTEGTGNCFYGQQAGQENIDGNSNSFIGLSSGSQNQSGSNNSYYGRSAGLNNRVSSYNVAIGSRSGFQNIGNRNTFIGYSADILNNTDSLNKTIAIGFEAKVDCDNCAVVGGVDTNAVHVGIGISKPEADLHVQGPDNTDAVVWDDGKAKLRHHFDALVWERDYFHLFIDSNNDQTDAKFSIFKDTSASLTVTPLVNFHLDGQDSWINSGGDFGIGTFSPSEKLEVANGNVRVTGGSFIDDGTTLSVPDYVFADEYTLLTLEEVDQYIEEKNHLPGVPSMDDIKGWSDLSLQDRDMLMLEKIEELFLHTIEQQKQILELEKQLKELSDK